MKKFYFFLAAFCFFNGASAQIINFPDANFKNRLISYNHDLNSDGEIDRAEALQVDQLRLEDANISNLSGVEFFTNVWDLNIRNNQLTTINISNLTLLQELDCENNQLTNLNLAGLINLNTVLASYNNLSAISLVNLPMLNHVALGHNQLQQITITDCPRIWYFFAHYNQLTTLDLSSASVNLNGEVLLDLSYNNLSTLFLKNNQRENLSIISNPNLHYICTEESQIANIQSLINDMGLTATCNVNSYCTFEPGGTFYTIQGNNKFDLNANGCDVSDLAIPNLKYSISNGSLTGSLISNASGEYSFPVQSGTHTVTPVFENPTYFNASPTASTITFPTQASPFSQNFCITANGVHPDLEISLLPISAARPGFDADYKLLFKNKGTHAQSGAVNLIFNDAVLDLVSANPIASNQAVNNLTWNFTDLQPFETREITLTLNVNSPTETPAVNDGTIFIYTASVTSATTDQMPEDNTFRFYQTVVNSLDPNDKTCLEGTIIDPSELGKYVHYMIRFENTGTFPAENIVVKDMIDIDKFEINSLVPIKGSHSFVTNITDGNKVEFIFENINLPFDNANNDGYVAFKIKTKPTLVGNTFSNSASIYFDYNFPIVTNTATTSIIALSTQDFGFESYFSLYPNPVNDVLNIETKQTIEVSSVNIYNQLGQLVLVVPNAQNVSKVDVSSLSSGNYFIKINSDKGTSNTKFIKN